MVKNNSKSKFWISLIWGLGIIIISIMIAIWISGYTYIYKTLIYTYPGIDDISIFSTRIVKDNNPQEWPVSTQYNKVALPHDLTLELENNESVAFLVIKNDSVIHEQYWDNYNKNSLSNPFSATKSIVGVLTGIAIGEGLISADDAVGKYIPEFNSGENSKLKIRHLLTMSSGLNWDESYSSLFSLTTEAYYGTNLNQLITNLKVVVEPGKTFRYMSCNTVLLAMIVSKASGMTISAYAEQKLWNPIGASQPAYWSLDHNEGLEKSYCCFYSTARDLAKIGKLYLDSGIWNGQRIVPADFVRESLTPNNCLDENGHPVDYYGYQWWLTAIDDHKIFYARGILGQYVVVIPDKKIIFVRLGKKRGEKTGNNQYTDMISYTKGVLKTF